MEYVKLGRTGLDVSRVALGAWSFADGGPRAHSWALDEEASGACIRRAVELGITFFDTANVYSDGASEEVLGRALARFTRRDEVVVATKVGVRMRPGPNGGGLSRKAILREAEASLRRLGTDYIDLYQIHRWDAVTPIEETLGALDDLVRSGKVRYIGASSMWAWQFHTALHISERRGWASFVSMQNHYNLLSREDEREMLPLCQHRGVAVLPWSPLARGRLSRPWGTATARFEADVNARSLYSTPASDEVIVERVGEIAARRGVSLARVALAWLLRKPFVTAPIVGATRPGHVDDAVAALGVHLSDDEVARLEEPYTPRPVSGHS